jgi:hypothetical protein
MKADHEIKGALPKRHGSEICVDLNIGGHEIGGHIVKVGEPPAERAKIGRRRQIEHPLWLSEEECLLLQEETELAIAFDGTTPGALAVRAFGYNATR